MKIIKNALVVILGFLFIACGELSSDSADEGGENPDVAVGTENIFFFATDFASSGQLYTAEMDPVGELTNSGVASLGSSAVIRLYDGLLYVLHDGFSVGSSDNLQIIDPANGYETINQFSTGNGTNPQDVVVVDDQAYISLYNPEQDLSNVNEDGHPADVIVMDLESGEITDRISFFDHLNNDGDRLGRASAMTRVGDSLYVCLQDLEADFSHNASGKIGKIATSSNQITGITTLDGRNPVDIVASEGKGEGTSPLLYVALQAPYDFSLGNFDTSLPYGGIEIISLGDASGNILIPDEALGGYVERLAVGQEKVFAVVSEMDPATFAFSSDIVVMDDGNEEANGSQVFLSGSSDVRDMATDSQNRLWVSRRSINANDGSASDPQVDVFDIDLREQTGSSLVPAVPVTSIAIGEI